jgi:hypothetical protein
VALDTAKRGAVQAPFCQKADYSVWWSGCKTSSVKLRVYTASVMRARTAVFDAKLRGIRVLLLFCRTQLARPAAECRGSSQGSGLGDPH